MLEKFNLLTPTPENVTDESIKLINGESKLISNIKNSDLLYGKKIGSNKYCTEYKFLNIYYLVSIKIKFIFIF